MEQGEGANMDLALSFSHIFELKYFLKNMKKFKSQIDIVSFF